MTVYIGSMGSENKRASIALALVARTNPSDVSGAAPTLPPTGQQWPLPAKAS